MRSVIAAVLLLLLSYTLGSAAPKTPAPRQSGLQFPFHRTTPRGTQLAFPLIEGADKLLQAGKEKEAFVQYLSIPGAEHLAGAIARRQPHQYLAFLRLKEAILPPASTHLIEGDLLLALGRKSEALEQYRVSAHFFSSPTNQKPISTTTLLPEDYYPVEPPVQPGFSSAFGAGVFPVESISPDQGGAMPGEPALPFNLGPGSHRDNWLIRRFILLQSWGDAAREFQRIWLIHRRNTQPYVTSLPSSGQDGAGSGPERRVVKPAGFKGRGLQFAIDYAYFLLRQRQTSQVLSVLLEPLLIMDMDLNPDTVLPGEIIPAGAPLPFGERPWRPAMSRSRYGQPTSAGMSRKEYIRLAFGQFKEFGKTDILVSALQAQIGKGENRARRVLARVRSLQGLPVEGTALELAYIEAAGFNPPSSAYRRGQMYESSRKLSEAAAEYEKVLALPDAPAQLPDEDEDGMDGWAMTRVLYRPSILSHLERLYTALGNTTRVLDIALEQLVEVPYRRPELEALQTAQERFRVAGQADRFDRWLQEQAGRARDLERRANLHWLQKDIPGVIAALAEEAKTNPDVQPYTYSEWKPRFRKQGMESLRTLLAALVNANPTDMADRLELLDLDDDAADQDKITTLEAILAPGALPALENGAGISSLDNRTRFHNYFDLAYRLMRLYEKAGQHDKLVHLGLRVARGQDRFGVQGLALSWEQHTSDVPVVANAALALAVENARGPEELVALRDALKGSPWEAARQQVERRLAGGWKTIVKHPVPWANLPAGVRPLASGESVLSLCRSDRYLFAGQPWGVTVYTLAGVPVARIALGTAALTLTTVGGDLWVGAATGLYRISGKDYKVAYLACNQDLPEADRKDPNRQDIINGVNILAVEGARLWIGTRRNVQVYNIRTSELRAFTDSELGVNDPGDWTRFLVDGSYVWVDGTSGCRRYDTRTDTWEAPAVPLRSHPMHLLGLIDGQLWADIYLNDTLQDRPCLIDRHSLRVTPVLVDGSPGALDARRPVEWEGRFHGRPVFDSHYYDVGAGKLRVITAAPGGTMQPLDTSLPAGLAGRSYWQRPDGALVSAEIFSLPNVVQDHWFKAEECTLLSLPDGSTVLGCRYSTLPRYRNAGEPDLSDGGTSNGSGGIYFSEPGGTWRNVTASDLPGNQVFCTLSPEDSGRTWLGTDGGLSLLDSQFNSLREISRRDGLGADGVIGAASLAGKLYFIPSRGYGGGLVVYDPVTTVFTSLTMADGLSTDQLDSIVVEGGRLKLHYALEYLPNGNTNSSYLKYSSNYYNPTSGEVEGRSEGQLSVRTETERTAAPPHLDPMPWLGGSIVAQQPIRGKHLLMGGGGVLVLDTPDVLKGPVGERMAPGTAPSTRVLGFQQWQLEDAARRSVTVENPEELVAALRDPNPLYRANALASVLNPSSSIDATIDPFFPNKFEEIAEFFPLIASQLDVPEVRIRSTALYLLTLSEDNARVIPLLRKRMDDKDEGIRRLAVMDLCRRGEVPDVHHLRPVLTDETSVNYSFGAGSTFKVMLDRDRLYAALAPHATAEIFRLLVEHPLSITNDEIHQEILKSFGRSLQTHPDAVPILLNAYNAGLGGNLTWMELGIFKGAGAPVLPMLHAALASNDRVVRSNAALGGGAIGSPTSIPYLMKALGMESGLSRSSIVWALGELKAQAALPQLARLYVDAKNDEKTGRGSGFRYQQSISALQSQYETISTVNAVGAGWDELAASTLRPEIDPRRNEALVTPREILDAVGKIGPAYSQEFYRALSAEGDDEARAEAALHLADCLASDRPRNILVLRGLLADSSPLVQIRAASGLLIFGDRAGERRLLEGLAAGGWEEGQTLEQFRKVGDGTKLRFARAALQTIADDKTEVTMSGEAQSLLATVPQP